MFRFNKDIGLFTLDRGKDTCKYSTEFCRLHCYNNKMYKAFGKRMRERDMKNEQYWQTATGEDIYKNLQHKQYDISRIRLCSRGEAFLNNNDVERVASWASYLSQYDINILVFTKAWRDDDIRSLIEKDLFLYPNLYIIASLDPDTLQYYDSLKDNKWIVSFFGNDSFEHPNFIKCPKTWKHLKSYCIKCNEGCFLRCKDIHFKMH
jgi:hypothetical protein